jgi:hypothetical protein
MKVTVDVFRSTGEPQLQVLKENVLGMMLSPGSIEVGLRPSKMRRVTFQSGEMGLLPRHLERWVGKGFQERLLLSFSEFALMGACDGAGGAMGLGHQCRVADARVASLVAAVNAERVAGLPTGRIFLRFCRESTSLSTC